MKTRAQFEKMYCYVSSTLLQKMLLTMGIIQIFTSFRSAFVISLKAHEVFLCSKRYLNFIYEKN
jgi:hypothetical protein